MVAHSRDVATQWSHEAAEAVLASAVAVEISVSERVNQRNTSVGLEQTKLKSSIAIIRQKLKEKLVEMGTEVFELSSHLDELYAHGDEARAGVTAKQCLAAARVAAESYIADKVTPMVVKLEQEVSDAQTVAQCRSTQGAVKQVTKALSQDALKDFYQLVGKTKKHLATESRRIRKVAATAGSAISSTPTSPLWTILTSMAGKYDASVSRPLFEAKGGVRMALVATRDDKDCIASLKNCSVVKKRG